LKSRVDLCGGQDQAALDRHGHEDFCSSRKRGIDTTTPIGKTMLQMVGIFAELERSMIQERVRTGLERAKAQGRTLGRPRCPSRISPL
jgi:DNA invertase Pin-like site-specific DNA recombinase